VLPAKRLYTTLLACLVPGVIISCTPDNEGEASTSASTVGGQGDCPQVASGDTCVAIDYLDFVHLNDTDYIAGLDGPRPSHHLHIQTKQATVRGAFGFLNEHTGQAPPPPHNGDAAFLPAGTAVYSIKGWSPQCRLAAKHDGEWYIYLAYKPRHATPKSCAVDRVKR
jgi:hypothetical protein